MRSWHRHLVVVAVVGLGMLGARGAWAAPVLWIDDSANNLGTVDIGTNTVTVIGNMGGDTMTDIAFAPNGILYGVSFANLYTINTTTAAATLVGATGQTLNALVFGADGTLYSAGPSGTNLYTVNTTTGSASSIGNIGFASAGDLAFNAGNLYMSSTGNTLIRISLPVVGGTSVGAMGFASVFGLATASNGVLYGVSGNNIFSTNTTTGAGTLVLTYGGGLGAANGTAFVDEANPVPEPSTLAAGVMAALVGLGIAARRRLSRSAS